MGFRRQSYTPGIAAFLLGLFILCASELSAQTAVKRQAILLRGAARVLGLPGFAPNAFPALLGEYKTESDEPIYVWASQEALYFDARLWKSRNLKKYRLLERDADPDDPELIRLVSSKPPLSPLRLRVLDRPFSQNTSPSGLSEWSIILAGTLLNNEYYDSITIAFLERFVYFLAGAKAPSDASFPAVLTF
ncbi:hypothetical protein MASR2M78_09960 [Treponema sp.]